ASRTTSFRASTGDAPSCSLEPVNEVGLPRVRLAHLAERNALGPGRIDVTESRDHEAPRVVLRHPARDVFGDALLGVEAKLILDVARDVGAPEAEISSPRR
ncbi:MAG: hypothetical protein ABJD07_10605, partial [Gemmatimonadaceae bacterium]